jgi:hypothetical protein
MNDRRGTTMSKEVQLHGAAEARIDEQVGMHGENKHVQELFPSASMPAGA